MLDLAWDATVVLREDRPGTLAKVTEAIAHAGINMEGFAELKGILHVMASDVTTARRVLDASGFEARTEQVVVLYAPDRPGTAAAIFRRIADAGINVSFAYVASNNRIVIGADEIQKLAEILSKSLPTP